MDGEGTHHTQDGHAGDQDGVGKAGDLRKAPAAQKADAQHKELDQHKAREEGVGHGRIAGKQLRSRLEALNDQSAHEHGGHGLAGDAQRQHGDQGAAGHGVVGCLRACYALDGAFSELLFVMGELPGGIIAQEAGDGCARAGKNADQVADDPGAEDGGGDPLDLLTAQGDLVAELGCLCPLLDFLLRQNQHLRHGEQTDQGAGGVDALIQRGLSEHEPLSALHGVHADGGQQQAQRTGDQALQQGLGRHARDNGQAEDRKPEIFRRSEFHGQLRQQRSEKVQRDAGEQTAAEGGEAGHGQRLARLPLQGELVALNGGGGRGGGARRVDQNGGDGAAEDRAAVDGAQHDQSRFRGHGKCHGQQQRNAHGGGQAWQTADDDADGGAAGHKQQIAEGHRVYEAVSHQG